MVYRDCQIEPMTYRDRHTEPMTYRDCHTEPMTYRDCHIEPMTYRDCHIESMTYRDCHIEPMTYRDCHIVHDTHRLCHIEPMTGSAPIESAAIFCHGALRPMGHRVQDTVKLVAEPVEYGVTACTAEDSQQLAERINSPSALTLA